MDNSKICNFSPQYQFVTHTHKNSVLTCKYLKLFVNFSARDSNPIIWISQLFWIYNMNYVYVYGIIYNLQSWCFLSFTNSSRRVGSTIMGDGSGVPAKEWAQAPKDTAEKGTDWSLSLSGPPSSYYSCLSAPPPSPKRVQLAHQPHPLEPAAPAAWLSVQPSIIKGFHILGWQYMKHDS